jgi:hypothetical protein
MYAAAVPSSNVYASFMCLGSLVRETAAHDTLQSVALGARQ